MTEEDQYISTDDEEEEQRQPQQNHYEIIDDDVDEDIDEIVVPSVPIPKASNSLNSTVKLTFLVSYNPSCSKKISSTERITFHVAQIVHRMKKKTNEVMEAIHLRKLVSKRKYGATSNENTNYFDTIEEDMEDLISPSSRSKRNHLAEDFDREIQDNLPSEYRNCITGLESNNGRFALIRSDKGYLIKGNFMDEASPFYNYSGYLHSDPTEFDNFTKKHRSFVVGGDKYAYVLKSPTSVIRPLNGQVMQDIFRYSNFSRITLNKVAEAWKLIEDLKRNPNIVHHLRCILDDISFSNEIRFHVLFVLEYLKTSLTQKAGNENTTTIVEYTGNNEASVYREPEFTLDSLYVNPWVKNYILGRYIDLIGKFYPSRIKYIYKMAGNDITELYDTILGKPFLLCFEKTRPYLCLDELSYHRLVTTREEVQLDIDSKTGSFLDPIEKIVVFIYHEILIASMKDEDKDTKRRNCFKWKILKNASNCYTDEKDIFDIVRGTFYPSNPSSPEAERTCQQAIKKLTDMSLVVVEYVDKNDRIIPKQRQYPFPGNHADIKHTRIFTATAYLATIRLAKVLKQMASRFVKMGPVPRRSNKQPFLNANPNIKLDEKQSLAHDAIWKNPVILLTGGAGMGKTATVNKMVESFDPNHVQITTFMAKTSSMLTQEIMPADTMHFYLAEHAKWVQNKQDRERQESDDSIPVDQEEDAENQNKGSRDAKPHPFSDIYVLIVDEATMASLPVLSQLVYILYKYGGLRQIIMAGHDWQLPAVEYGSVFSDLIEAYPNLTYRLETNHRSESNTIYENSLKVYKYHRMIDMKNLRTQIQDNVNGSSKSRSKQDTFLERLGLNLNEDDSFRFIDPGDSWKEDETKRSKILNILGMQCVSQYKDFVDNDLYGNNPAIQERSSGMKLFRNCMWRVLDSIHFVALKNSDVETLNRILHEELFATGFMSGMVDENPPKILNKYLRMCEICKGSISKARTDDDNDFMSLDDDDYDGNEIEQRNTLQKRLESGSGCLWIGEKFYYTKNNRANKTKNGEVLRICGYVDILVTEQDQIQSYINQNQSKKRIRSAYHQNGPQHTFDGIISREKQMVISIGEPNENPANEKDEIKYDTYIVNGPWTNYQNVHVVRLVEVSYENNYIAWIQSINIVNMAYEYERGIPKSIFAPKKNSSSSSSYSPKCIRLGMVTTIHKYQGAEQKIVVYVLGKDLDYYSTCQHAYVAITRASQCVIILGTKQVLAHICANGPVKRKTGLIEIVKSMEILKLHDNAIQAIQDANDMNAEGGFDQDFNIADLDPIPAPLKLIDSNPELNPGVMKRLPNLLSSRLSLPTNSSNMTRPLLTSSMNCDNSFDSISSTEEQLVVKSKSKYPISTNKLFSSPRKDLSSLNLGSSILNRYNSSKTKNITPSFSAPAKRRKTDLSFLRLFNCDDD